MPIPPTCTAKRKSSSLSFGSQTARVRELAGLLVANVACPAFGAVCIPVQCIGETLGGPGSPTLRDGHAVSVTALMISRHRVFPRCRLGFSAMTVNTGAQAPLRRGTGAALEPDPSRCQHPWEPVKPPLRSFPDIAPRSKRRSARAPEG